jgi:hypothetical protein
LLRKKNYSQNPKRTVPKLIDELAVRYMDRPGGYTRVFHYGHRPGDHAPTAILEFVDGENDVKFSLTAKSLGRELALAELEEVSGSTVTKWRNSSVVIPEHALKAQEQETAENRREEVEEDPMEILAREANKPVQTEPMDQVLENIRNRYTGLPIKAVTALNVLKCLRYRTTADLHRFDELAKQAFDRALAESEIGHWKPDAEKVNAAKYGRFQLRTLPGDGIRLVAGAPRVGATPDSDSRKAEVEEEEWVDYDQASTPWKRAAGSQRRPPTEQRESRMRRYGEPFELKASREQ